MSTYTRRSFLKISAATIAAASVGGKVASYAAENLGSPAPSEKGIRRVPTFCDICFWKCGAIATVRDGKLWKIEGNPDDPLSRGRLCPRGSGGIGHALDPDRLRTPLVRTGERGQESWKAVSWDEAFEVIATKLNKLKAEHGPESLALFSHGIGGAHFHHLAKAFGTPNSAAPSFAQCRGPRDTGFILTFGDGVGGIERTDLRSSDCIVLIGTHLGENMHNTQVQEFSEAVGRGASIIVVDPRFSVAASKAKYYLPIKPGTDLALLLAWMNVIVTEKLYDAEYVEKYGYGFDQFAASIRTCTPEWAYPETGIEPELIRATAREMARHRPASLVHPGRHSNWYGNDSQRARAVALLNALLGSWGRKGGIYVASSVSVPKYPTPPYPKPARGPLDNPGNRYPFATEAITTGIREATITGKPYPIKAWMVYATNLLYSLPNQAETIEAIRKLDFLVVVDALPSEIAGWADVVLPESVYLERYDELSSDPFREPFLSLRQPVVESPHDQKPGWWIAKNLGEKMGLGAYFPWKDMEEYLDRRLRGAGYTLDQLKRAGVVRGKPQPTYFEDGAVPEFDTPSGKIEFYSLQLQKAGFDPVPVYTPPDQPPPGSFRLLFGRASVHTFSRTENNRILADVMGENALWVNSAVVRDLGFRDGDYVVLRNQDGVRSNRILLRATERIRPDCVYMVHGFGHTSRALTKAFGKGASDSQLLTRYKTDPLMGGTGLNVNFVTLESEA